MFRPGSAILQFDREGFKSGYAARYGQGAAQMHKNILGLILTPLKRVNAVRLAGLHPGPDSPQGRIVLNELQSDRAQPAAARGAPRKVAVPPEI